MSRLVHRVVGAGSADDILHLGVLCRHVGIREELLVDPSAAANRPSAAETVLPLP